MRGRQIAAVLPSARYASSIRSIDWSWPDVVVLVKRAAEVWWKEAAACGKPIVWDVLDFWPQPNANTVPVNEHRHRIAQVQRECRASLLIGATEAMARDIGGLYLPHHCRLGLAPTEPRATASVVAYDGSPRYLGSWAPAISKACEALGLQFVLNPAHLSTADILVSFRDAEWDGEVCRQWKSGVKFVNAICAGRPIVTHACAALTEIRPMSVTIDSLDALTEALDLATGPAFRERAYEDGLQRAPGFTVDAIAARYLELLRRVVRRAA